ncbi:MAG: undecaprenyl-diphosphate phosphatase [Ilumatobacteraceae bacterium]
MPILHAIVLGLIQGLSEFLPISSSGHLLLAPWLFGWNDFPDTAKGRAIEKAFDVALHLGTLVAALAYFRKDIVTYTSAGVRLVVKREKPVTQDARIAWLLVLSSVPAAIAGALFESSIDNRLGTPTIIAISLIVFGMILFVADRVLGKRTISNYGQRDAIAIGMAQVLALNPGTSRSGITMTAGRFLGFDRDTAARVSFLMSLPVIGGAVVLKMAKLFKDGIPDGLVTPMIIGIVTSGLSGWLAVWGTLKLIRTRSFTPFVIYRIVLGVVVLVIVAAGWR